MKKTLFLTSWNLSREESLQCHELPEKISCSMLIQKSVCFAIHSVYIESFNFGTELISNIIYVHFEVHHKWNLPVTMDWIRSNGDSSCSVSRADNPGLDGTKYKGSFILSIHMLKEPRYPRVVMSSQCLWRIGWRTSGPRLQFPSVSAGMAKVRNDGNCNPATSRGPLVFHP